MFKFFFLLGSVLATTSSGVLIESESLSLEEEDDGEPEILDLDIIKKDYVKIEQIKNKYYKEPFRKTREAKEKYEKGLEVYKKGGTEKILKDAKEKLVNQKEKPVGTKETQKKIAKDKKDMIAVKLALKIA